MTDDRRSTSDSALATVVRGATAAAGFHITAGKLGPNETVVVTNPDAGLQVVIAHRGATLLNWHTTIDDGQRIDLVDGYATAAELDQQDGVRNGIMAPFTNRIARGRYLFNNTEHRLGRDGQHPAQPTYHGFLRTTDMSLLDASATNERAVITFTTKGVRPGAFPGYPFAVDAQVSYLVTHTGLQVEVTGHNIGDAPAPFATGWHPYFRLGEAGIDPLELTVPASSVIQTDAALIPHAGAGAYQALDNQPALDYRRPRPIGTAVLDTCFADLSADADGRCRTTLRDPATGRTLVVWQQRGLMHVFTGDTLARGPRRSVALEPVEVMTDAFNRAEAIPAISLAPGHSRTFRFGAEILTSDHPATPSPRKARDRGTSHHA
jgi:aldose 1-epimerase